MNPSLRMRQYQEQAIFSSSPEQLIVKLFDLGIAACHQGDRKKLRTVLQELISSLNFEDGGDIAQRLYSIYEYCLDASVSDDLDVTLELIGELRDAWKTAVVDRKAA